MALKLANLAVSKLAASITEGATTLSIQNGDTGKFPILADGDWHPATIIDQAGNLEIVRVIARAGATLTVTRAQEGTTAKAFAAGSRIDIRLTAATVLAIIQKFNDDVATLNSALDTKFAEAGGILTGFLQAPQIVVDYGANEDAVARWNQNGIQRFAAFVPADGQYLVVGKYKDNGDWNGPAVDIHRNTGVASFWAKFIAHEGADFRGEVNFPGHGNNLFRIGTGDGASYTTHNFILKGWWGLGMADAGDAINGYYDFRSGTWDVKGAFKVNGNVVPHGGFKASKVEILAGVANKFPDAEAVKAAVSSFVSGDQPNVLNGLGSVAHGLGVKPSKISAYLVCTATQNGWSVGEEIELGSHCWNSGGNYGIMMWSDATNLYWKIAQQGIAIISKSDGITVVAAPANFALRLRGAL